MNHLSVIICLLLIFQSCSTSSGTFDSSSAKRYAGVGTEGNSGYADNTFNISMSSNLPDYSSLKNGLKSVLACTVPSGVFQFSTISREYTNMKVTVEVGSSVPEEMYTAITDFMVQQGYSVTLKRNQPGMGNSISIW